MSSSRDVEKGEPDEENWALLGTRNEGRQDDGEHLNRADDIELAEFEKPGPSSRNIANSNVKTEEQNQFQEPDLSEGTIQSKTNESEESTDELQEPEPDQNFSLIKAIYNYGNEELISWLKNLRNPYACPIPILRAACQAQSNEDALQILLDARRYTPLHAAARTNDTKSIAKILGFPEGLTNERTVDCRTRFGTLFKGERSLVLRFIPPGSTALHVASAYAHSQAVRALLMAGANPNLRDERNFTPLDVAGELCPSDDVQSYVETLQLLLEKDGSLSKDTSKVLETALNTRSLQALRLLLDVGAPINKQHPLGYTPMHLCVRLRLKEHLEVLVNHSSPEMDYRAVDVTDKEGSTVLHWAACEGWSDGVTVALLAGANITVENSVGDTALHLAAKAGNFDIVKQILDYDKNKQCDFIKKNVKGESPFSYAILSGNADIVKHMCNLNHDMLIYLNTIKIGNLNPLEYAAEKNFQELFFELQWMLSKYPFDKSVTPRLLKILAKHNLPELFAKVEKDFFPRFVTKTIIAKEYIIHEAIKHNSREMIIALLREGADLSQRNNDGQTAISLLMYRVTKPTEFMTEVLDGCINTAKNISENDCVIKINYSVLKPENEYVDNSIKFDDDNNNDDGDDNNDDDDDNNNNDDGDDNNDDDYNDHLKTKANDMRVLEALIETGDVYDQRSLLTHPVVESFLYLKWKKCAKFINFLISVYVLFLLSLNIFIGTFYYHMDHKIKEQDIRRIFKPTYWRFIAFCTLLVFCLLDIFFSSSSITKLPCNKTIWLKLLSSITMLPCNITIWLKKISYITLKFLLFAGGLVMICIPMDDADNDVVRGLAVITVSLSWIYLMIFLSWTPTLGYYMQMYGKVSRNVIKVMLSFSFPLVGFSICFMILLRSKEPFDDPIAAFLKTMVMLSFSFPLVGFSICFMILLRSKEPFDDPIAAFLKTMVMMTSEFEYENLMKNKTTDSPKDATNSTLDFLEDAPLTSVFMLRIFFLLFLICVAIVLMNLMLGVAVSDFQELAHDGRQRRLMKQIECINALERLCQRKPFSSFEFIITEKWKVPLEVLFTSDSKIFGKKIKENILNKAQSLKETKEKEADDVGLKAKIDDITKTQLDVRNELSEIRKSVNSNAETVEKRIAEAVNNILEAIANERRADLNLGQKK